MDQNGALYQSLRDQIDKLEKRCATLESELSRTLKIFDKNANWVLQELKSGLAEHWDNLSRIAQLEGKVFPSLKVDLEHLRRTIGPVDGPYDNPLDRKK